MQIYYILFINIKNSLSYDNPYIAYIILIFQFINLSRKELLEG